MPALGRKPASQMGLTCRHSRYRRRFSIRRRLVPIRQDIFLKRPSARDLLSSKYMSRFRAPHSGPTALRRQRSAADCSLAPPCLSTWARCSDFCHGVKVRPGPPMNRRCERLASSPCRERPTGKSSGMDVPRQRHGRQMAAREGVPDRLSTPNGCPGSGAPSRNRIEPVRPHNRRS